MDKPYGVLLAERTGLRFTKVKLYRNSNKISWFPVKVWGKSSIQDYKKGI